MRIWHGMRQRGRALTMALLAIWGSATPAAVRAPAPIPVAAARAGQFVDLTPAFTANFDANVDKTDDQRLAAFHAAFDPLMPGYYHRSGDNQARFEKAILSHLHDFPARRASFVQTATGFRAAFEQGQRSFRRAFPDYRLTVPVYLVHSMGQQDGGTRSIAGKTVMVFGADVIARIHDAQTIGPFLDHELFHIYHERLFGECPSLWCSVWEEGLAVYVAAQLNPGADDRQLLLNNPRPIRPEVAPRLVEAMCRLRASIDSTDQARYAEFLQGDGKGPFPPRYGYLLGLLIAEKIGKDMPLSAMARLNQAQARPLIDKALASFGECPAAG